MFENLPVWYKDNAKKGVTEVMNLAWSKPTLNELIVRPLQTHEHANNLRRELKSLADLIAKSVQVGKRPDDMEVEPYIPPSAYSIQKSESPLNPED